MQATQEASLRSGSNGDKVRMPLSLPGLGSLYVKPKSSADALYDAQCAAGFSFIENVSSVCSLHVHRGICMMVGMLLNLQQLHHRTLKCKISVVAVNEI